MTIVAVITMITRWFGFKSDTKPTKIVEESMVNYREQRNKDERASIWLFVHMRSIFTILLINQTAIGE